MKQKIFYISYIVAVLLGLWLLFFCMFHRDETIAADVTKQSDDLDYAKQLEEYVSRKFAFRKEVIATYTSLQQRFFASSPVKDVIIGEEGYLFYEDTVADYSGLNRWNDRELYTVAKTLELMGESVAADGGRFLLLIAPNKNSLYDYMPYNYRKRTEPSNAERLLTALEHVDYVNLFDLFKNREKELYFKTDTHWSDEGAYYVYEAAQQALAQEPIRFLEQDYAAEKSMVGDLSNMLYPDCGPTEETLVFEEPGYEFLTRTRSFEQNYIETVCVAGANRLLMFRDSFVNNLIGYFSESYEHAVYDKSLPYDLTQQSKHGSNVVIVEIAERNMGEILAMAPVMSAPKREKINGVEVEDLWEAFNVTEANGFIRISGTLQKQYTSPETDIYARVNGTLYELTPVSSENSLYGFEGYVATEKSEQLSVVVVAGDTVWEQTYVGQKE